MLGIPFLRQSVSALIPGGDIAAQHYTVRDHINWHPEFYQSDAIGERTAELARNRAEEDADRLGVGGDA